MKPHDLVALVLAALAVELHEMDTDLTEARLVRAEAYLSWLKGDV